MLRELLDKKVLTHHFLFPYLTKDFVFLTFLTFFLVWTELILTFILVCMGLGWYGQWCLNKVFIFLIFCFWNHSMKLMRTSIPQTKFIYTSMVASIVSSDCYCSSWIWFNVCIQIWMCRLRLVSIHFGIKSYIWVNFVCEMYS